MAPIGEGAADAPELPVNENEHIDEYVRDYFKDIPLMQKVAFCESTYRHFGEDGNVLRGVKNTGDIGVMQINEFYHSEKAEELGIDLHELDGNLAYARYLFTKEGVTPWLSSGKCWG